METLVDPSQYTTIYTKALTTNVKRILTLYEGNTQHWGGIARINMQNTCTL